MPPNRCQEIINTAMLKLGETKQMIDINKQYQTRDGRNVRILCTDRITASGKKSIVGLVTSASGCAELLYIWNSSGHYMDYFISDDDLVPVKVKKEGWINIYRDSSDGGILCSSVFLSKACAEAYGQLKRMENLVSTIKITWEE